MGLKVEGQSRMAGRAELLKSDQNGIESTLSNQSLLQLQLVKIRPKWD